MNMTIDTVASNAVEALKKALRFYPSFSTLQPTVDIEGEDQAIIQFEGGDMFIAVELMEEKRGLGGRTFMVPKFHPGYYKQVGGNRWNPPETEDVYIDGACDDVIEALAALVKLDFINQVTNMNECEAFVEEMAFMEENAEAIANAIRNK